MDLICPDGNSPRRRPKHPRQDAILPTVAYGYTGHVMDFPAPSTTTFEHFMHHVLDITKSLAYHGFKKIVF